MKELDSETLLEKAQALGNDIKELESIDSFRAYNVAKKKIVYNRRKLLYATVMKYAAFLTLPLLLTSVALGYLYFRDSEIEQKYAEVTAANGIVIRYELPDNSAVWLNSGTTLRYPVTFSKDERNVSLNGEAYFEVQANKRSPFYVNTPEGVSVYVYGTKFNVSAYGDAEDIETVLEEGKVNVISPDRKTVTQLMPGEKLAYNKLKCKISKSRVDVYEKTAWKDGKLIFRNTSLDDIFKRLARHYNVDIQFTNHSGKEYKYRATFREETLPQILDYLAKSATLKWRTEDAVQHSDTTFTKKKIIVDLY